MLNMCIGSSHVRIVFSLGGVFVCVCVNEGVILGDVTR